MQEDEKPTLVEYRQNVIKKSLIILIRNYYFKKY